MNSRRRQAPDRSRAVRLLVPMVTRRAFARSTAASAASTWSRSRARHSPVKSTSRPCSVRRTSTSISGVVAVAANPDSGKQERSSDCEPEPQIDIQESLAHLHIVEEVGERDNPSVVYRFRRSRIDAEDIPDPGEGPITQQLRDVAGSECGPL